MRRAASAVFILALLPLTLRAQGGPSALRTSTVGGVHVGSPSIISVAVGGYRTIARTRATERTQDVFALLEPGVNAGRVSIGFGDTSGTFGTGWAIRGTLLRTWRRESANYVGAEVSAMALGFGPRLGLFRRVDTGGAGLRVTADVAFGL